MLRLVFLPTDLSLTPLFSPNSSFQRLPDPTTHPYLVDVLARRCCYYCLLSQLRSIQLFVRVSLFIHLLYRLLNFYFMYIGRSNF